MPRKSRKNKTLHKRSRKHSGNLRKTKRHHKRQRGG